MQTEIEFPSEDGTATLRGWVFRPEAREAPLPGVVMAHGYGGVKQWSRHFAEAFCEAGLAVLLYDHRNSGASDGEPRFHCDGTIQQRDYQQAITIAQGHSAFDGDRIGIWGTSYAGAHVLQVAGLDRRVKAVVSQVPAISGYDFASARAEVALWREMIEEDRLAQLEGAPPTLVKMVEDPEQPSGEFVLLPGEGSWKHMTEGPEGHTEGWLNQTTVRSLAHLLEVDVRPWLPRISPTPVMFIVTTADRTTPTDQALAAYEMLLEPKELLLMSGTHYSVYNKGEGFEQASAGAIDWFTRWL